MAIRLWLGAAVALTCLLSSEVGAFGDRGHRVVGHVAELHLAGSRALSEITRILEPGETLPDAAVWLDAVRAPTYEDADTALFRVRHPAHEVYHFTNLPFQTRRYDAAAVGAHATDIVWSARESVRVLRGRSTFFTKREALRILTHLVGDIHQPLHVGNSYVASEGRLRFVLPEGPAGWRSTLGGNALRYGPKDTFNLHGYWDAHAVNLTMQKQEPGMYAARLVTELGLPQGWRNEGDVESWPEQWATEGLVHARDLHAGIRIIEYVGPDQAGRTAHLWRIEQPPGYDKVARSLVPTQLAKAGYRLAATLLAIWDKR